MCGKILVRLLYPSGIERVLTIATLSQTTVALRYTTLYYRDRLFTDDGSRKNNTNLGRQLSGNNEVNEVTVQGSRQMRAGDEKQVILL